MADAANSLQEKLTEIARIEEENGLLGSSFAMRVDDDRLVVSDEVVDYVLEVTRKTVKILERRESILIPEDRSPASE